jgi:hypothetical protein
MEKFCIPWSCLDLTSKQVVPEKKQSKPQKSFAHAVSNVCDIPMSQMPQPCVKGDRIAIAIPEVDYMVGMEECKFNLHGRIIWPKGSTPLTVVALKNKLAPLWKDLSKWGIMSLGKGFYEFSFSTLEDVRRVHSIASWNLNPGLLKLFAWSRDFNPRIQQNVSAQVWVRIHGLSQEYWRPNIIFAIASSIGTPLCTDAVTAKPLMEQTFGQYARVLVDMDLSQTLRHKVLVERKGFAFFVELEFENLPHFCSNCNVIGHHVGNCKKLNYTEDEIPVKDGKDKQKQAKEANKIYKQTKDGRVDQNLPKEVIIVGSAPDKVVVTVPVINNTPQCDKSSDKRNELNKVDVIPVSSSTSKVTKSPTKSTNQKSASMNISQEEAAAQAPLKRQNMFAVLAGQDLDCDSANSKHLTSNSSDRLEDDDDGDSEFVDATQHEDTSVDDDTPSKVDSLVNMHQNNMNFLKQSWANMAEDDEAENNLLEELENEHLKTTIDSAEAPFKVVEGRTKSKIHKKSSTSKINYGTRSKVGNPKPFK